MSSSSSRKDKSTVIELPSRSEKRGISSLSPIAPVVYALLGPGRACCPPAAGGGTRVAVGATLLVWEKGPDRDVVEQRSLRPDRSPGRGLRSRVCFKPGMVAVRPPYHPEV